MSIDSFSLPSRSAVFTGILFSDASELEIELSRELTEAHAGSEFWAWRKDVLRPDRTTDARAPPAPKANSNVPGGPFGR
jgi:hypothetical protein